MVLYIEGHSGFKNKRSINSNSRHLVIIILGRECRECCGERGDLEIKQPTDTQSGAAVAGVYTQYICDGRPKVRMGSSTIDA